MKLKGIALLICVIGVMRFSSAQKNIEWGAKAGFNYSGLNLSSGGKLVGTIYHTAPGYHLGAYAEMKIKKFKNVSIQPELVYSSQGQYFTTVSYSNLKTTLNYLNIPIIIKYYLAGSLHLEVGPQLGILVSSKGDLNQIGVGGNFAGPPIFNQDLGKFLKSTDFAVVFGAGVNLPLDFSLAVRYNLGISDINKNTGSQLPFEGGLQPSFSTANTSNQVLQVSLGYRIHKHKVSK